MGIKSFFTKPELLIIYKTMATVTIDGRNASVEFYYNLYENRFKMRWIEIKINWQVNNKDILNLIRFYHPIYFEKLLPWKNGLNFADIPSYQTIHSQRLFNTLSGTPEIQIKEIK
jgi:hypothetical protein